MNRRHFISSLLGAAGAIALDPEKLLWVPGAKTIFVPPPIVRVGLPEARWRWIGYEGQFDPRLLGSNSILRDMTFKFMVLSNKDEVVTAKR